MEMTWQEVDPYHYARELVGRLMQQYCEPFTMEDMGMVGPGEGGGCVKGERQVNEITWNGMSASEKMWADRWCQERGLLQPWAINDPLLRETIMQMAHHAIEGVDQRLKIADLETRIQILHSKLAKPAPPRKVSARLLELAYRNTGADFEKLSKRLEEILHEEDVAKWVGYPAPESDGKTVLHDIPAGTVDDGVGPVVAKRREWAERFCKDNALWPMDKLTYPWHGIVNHMAGFAVENNDLRKDLNSLRAAIGEKSMALSRALGNQRSTAPMTRKEAITTINLARSRVNPNLETVASLDMKRKALSLAWKVLAGDAP